VVMSLARKCGRIEATASMILMPPAADNSSSPPPPPPQSLLLPRNLFINNVPNTLETRFHFYDAVVDAVEQSLRDPSKATLVPRMQIKALTPELDPSTDSYRLGTLLELVRELATRLACSGLRVRVCVQGKMGRGVFVGLPLSLNGVRQILEMMDWQSGPGEAYEGLVPNYVRFGEVGASEVDKDQGSAPDDVFIVIMPQNIVGFTLMPELQEMVEAAAGRPVLLINPKLGDIASSEDVMSVRGRAQRLAFERSFQTIYEWHTLYPAPSRYYPILGALVKAGPREPYVAFERQERRRGQSWPSEVASAYPPPSLPDQSDDDGIAGEAGPYVPSGVGASPIWERHVPRGSYDDLPSDPAVLDLLRKSGARWT